MSPPTRLRFLLLAALGLAGCPAVSSYQTADPLPPGDWQVSAALDGLLLHDTEQEVRAPSGQFALGVRRGLFADLDAGLKLYTFGLDCGVRWRLVHGVWSVALLPTLGATRTLAGETTTDALHFFGHLPLVATRPLSDRWSLTLGPRLFWGLYWPTTGGQAQGWMAGATASLAWRVGDHWQLVPELNLLTTLHGEVPVHGRYSQVGLGVLWEP